MDSEKPLKRNYDQEIDEITKDVEAFRSRLLIGTYLYKHSNETFKFQCYPKPWAGGLYAEQKKRPEVSIGYPQIHMYHEYKMKKYREVKELEKLKKEEEELKELKNENELEKVKEREEVKKERKKMKKKKKERKMKATEGKECKKKRRKNKDERKMKEPGSATMTKVDEDGIQLKKLKLADEVDAEVRKGEIDFKIAPGEDNDHSSTRVLEGLKLCSREAEKKTVSDSAP